MPAAKCGQIDVQLANNATGHYDNIDYLGANQRGRNDKSEGWQSNCAELTYPSNTSNDIQRWVHVQRDVIGEYLNSSGIVNRQKQLKPSNFNRNPTSYAEDSAHQNRNNNNVSCYPPLNTQPSWREPACRTDTAVQSYCSGRSDAYEAYPLCSSFNSKSIECAPRICCSNNGGVMHSSSDLEYWRTKLKSSAEVHLHSYQSDRVCTEQPRSTVDRMTQLDLAIEHCRRAEARQQKESEQCRAASINNSVYSDYKTIKYESNCGPEIEGSRWNNFNPNMFVEATNSEAPTNQAPYSQSHTDISSDFGDCSSRSKSLSSDVEVGSKLSPVAKLNAQIRRLREEMLELRSTTITYKKHMEKMFEDLTAISRMQERGKSPWLIPDNRHIDPNDYSTLSNYDEHLTTATSSRSYPTAMVNAKHEIPLKNTNRTKDEPVHSIISASNNTELDSSRDACDDVIESTISTKKVKPRVGVECGEVAKRNKASGRPNSDPFTCGVTDNLFSSDEQEPNSTMSLPHSPSNSKSSKKMLLPNALAKTKLSNDHLRILPVLSRSNAALHISECSIDSGYQGSSVTSPRDRHGRELSSQVVTPASPITESPVESTKYVKEASKATNCDQPRATVGLCAMDESSKESVSNEELIAKANNVQSSDTLYIVPSKSVRLKHYDVPNDVNRVLPKARTNICSMTNEPGDTSIQLERPVPKQRTVFAAKIPETSNNVLLEKENLTSINDVVVSSKVSDERGYSSPDESEELKEDDTSLGSSEAIQNIEDKRECSNSAIVPVHKQGRPAPPQCLTVVKAFPQTSGDAGSPVQSRVKLGISAISIKLSSNSAQKEGPVYYTARQDTKINEATTRMRKNANAKQLLREKFAAAVEYSSALKKSAKDDDDSESSMVRRRSMRMMTEFQIFDFKDSLINLSSMPSTDSIVNKPDAVKQTNAKEISSPLSNPTLTPTSCSTYSVSPSAASLSKQIFEAEKKNIDNNEKPKLEGKKHHLANIKQPQNIPEYPNNYENIQSSSFASKPLPPPPVPPPSSPPLVVADAPLSLTGSQNSIFSEVELVPQVPAKRPTALFLAPLIRPKASLPGMTCDVTSPPAMHKSTFYGLKISPTGKSAFTPVLSTSLRALSQKPISDRCDVPFSRDNDEIHPNIQGLKRRVSLPLSTVSNRQKLFNELNQNCPVNIKKASVTPGSEIENTSPLQRRSSLRATRNKTETVDSVISAEQATVTSFQFTDKNQINHSPTKANKPISTEPIDQKCKQSKTTRDEHRIQQCADKSWSSNSRRHDLENQPVRYDRCDNISNVVGALRDAGYLHNNSTPNSEKQVSMSNTSSLGSSKSQIKDSKRHQAGVQSSIRSSKAQGQALKSKSSSDVHHYEIVRDAKSSNKVCSSWRPHDRHRPANQLTLSPPHNGASEQQSPTRHHKSTVAMLRASLMGKREKPQRSVATEGKRDACNNIDNKSRSASADVKKKNVESSTVKSPTKNRVSESKIKVPAPTKKSKQEMKSQKEKHVAKKMSKEGKANDQSNDDSSGMRDVVPPLPGSGSRYHGDAEVMEKFLTAAAASHATRSPLQRLRSSFRTPRNKTKLSQSSRVKDDMDVAGGRSFIGSRNDKKPLKHEHFTYV